MPPSVKTHFDWKFSLSLFIALAGVVIPIWLWQVDLDAKNLSLKIVSTTSLSPNGSASMEGVRVTLDDKSLEIPYVSVLEIENTGSRPITQSDFESPISLSVSPPATVVKAQIKDTNPVDLKPTISVSNAQILLNPLLLNPKDRFQITILTAGALPDFAVRSRVAGVSTVLLTDTVVSRTARRYWLRTTVSVLLFSVYFCAALKALEGIRKGKFLPESFLLGFITLSAGTLLALPSIETFSLFNHLLPIVGAGVIIGLLFRYGYGRTRREEREYEIQIPLRTRRG
jgi:hypothetical protein